MVEDHARRQPLGPRDRTGSQGVAAGLFRAWDLFAPKICGHGSEFARQHGPCFFQLARSRILSSDVIVLNHTLFLHCLGTVGDEVKHGVLFKNDFVIFDEAHHVERVASRHIGLSVSSPGCDTRCSDFGIPRTGKGLLATLQQGKTVEMVADVLSAAEGFFTDVENVCEILNRTPGTRGAAGRAEASPAKRRRAWTELRIRRPDLVADRLTLPIQRLRDGGQRPHQDQRRP
jgi:ATP-dependent DNA helicase DinG